ncbi:MAG: conjugal transfer protein TraF [Candidatus Nitrospinota bacterium M3_3B_026]
MIADVRGGLLLIAAAILLLAAPVSAQETAPACSRCGWFWYADPVEDGKEEAAPDETPSPAELWETDPARFRELLDEARAEAVRTLSEEDVHRYFEMQQIASDKAAAFAAVSKVVSMKHPELSGGNSYPIAHGGRRAMLIARTAEKRDVILSAREDFALVYFRSDRCGFCAAQDPVIKRLADRYGLTVRAVDSDAEPAAAARFGVDTVPAILLVGRETGGHLYLANGVVSLDELETSLFRGIRLLRGDVEPERFHTWDYERGGEAR